MKVEHLFNVQDKLVLITGATGHLGRAMAQAFAENGAHVLINSRSSKNCDTLVEEFKDLNLEATAVPFDVTCDAEIQAQLLPVLQRFKKIDVLINNAYYGVAKKLRI